MSLYDQACILRDFWDREAIKAIHEKDAAAYSRAVQFVRLSKEYQKDADYYCQHESEVRGNE